MSALSPLHAVFSCLRAAQPWQQALLAQLVAVLLMLVVVWLAPGGVFLLWQAVLLQAVLAAAIGFWLGLPPWWLPLHLGFLPAVLLASRLGIAAGWYLAGFVLLLLIFWRLDRSRVPLYLSNAQTAAAVLQLLPDRPCRVLDLGCAHGGLLRYLARARPDCHFVGVEHAPLPWLWAWLSARACRNLQIRHGDFWQTPLAGFDVVYVFLSPAPMARLYTQVRSQLPAGGVLISNSFAVPAVQPDAVFEVNDRRHTRLFCYDMQEQRTEQRQEWQAVFAGRGQAGE